MKQETPRATAGIPGLQAGEEVNSTDPNLAAAERAWALRGAAVGWLVGEGA